MSDWSNDRHVRLSSIGCQNMSVNICCARGQQNQLFCGSLFKLAVSNTASSERIGYSKHMENTARLFSLTFYNVWRGSWVQSRLGSVANGHEVIIFDDVTTVSQCLTTSRFVFPARSSQLMIITCSLIVASQGSRCSSVLANANKPQHIVFNLTRFICNPFNPQPPTLDTLWHHLLPVKTTTQETPYAFTSLPCRGLHS